MSVGVMLAGIFAVVAGLVAYTFFTDYTRKIVVTGYLKPKTGAVNIISNKTGQLSIEVANGAKVKKGQLIARISEISSDARGRSLLALEIENIEQTIKFLLERIKLSNDKSASLKEQQKLLLEQHRKKIKSALRQV